MDHGRDRRQEELSRLAAASLVVVVRRRRTAIRARCGVSLLACCLISGCATPQPPTSSARTGKILTIGVPEGIAGTDLGARQLAQALSQEGLTQLSPDGRVLARLAKSWVWEKDGLELRVRLEPGVTSHDGAPVTAATVVAALERALERPESRARYPSLNFVTAVTSSGDDVLIALSQPSAFLPEDLELPLETGAPGIGTGAFRVVSAGSRETVLERFERYRGGSPSIERVVIRPFQTTRAAWTNLLRRDVDMVTDVPPQAVEFVSNDDVQVIPFERRYQYLIAFNSSKPPFSSRGVRRALNAAVNRATLIANVLEGHGSPSTGPIWPKYWAYDSAIDSYTFDVPLAASLLDAAGFQLPAASSREAGPRARFRFTCLMPAGFSTWERIGLEVQRSLYNVGVDMQFQVVPAAEFDGLIREGNFDAALIDMISGPTPGRASLFWQSARRFKGLNVFGYENPEAERLFDLLRSSTNEAAVRSATRGLQRAFLDDPPALFLAWNQRARAVRRAFQIPEESGRDPVSTLWRWTPAAAVLAASAP